MGTITIVTLSWAGLAAVTLGVVLALLRAGGHADRAHRPLAATSSSDAAE